MLCFNFTACCTANWRAHLRQNSKSGVLAVYWAYIWLRFIKWNAKALTHVGWALGKTIQLAFTFYYSTDSSAKDSSLRMDLKINNSTSFYFCQQIFLKVPSQATKIYCQTFFISDLKMVQSNGFLLSVWNNVNTIPLNKCLFNSKD